MEEIILLEFSNIFSSGEKKELQSKLLPKVSNWKEESHFEQP